jgi:hypothetical protein
MSSASEDFVFKIHLEYGHYEHFLYWGFDVLVRDDAQSDAKQTQLVLSVRRDDDGGAATRVPLGNDAAQRLWERVERLKMWDMPATDYTSDLSDDLYHLGATVVLLRGTRHFCHRVPTGVAVRVPVLSVTKDQMINFHKFVTETCRDVEQLSGVTVPQTVSLRWKARHDAMTSAKTKGPAAVDDDS